MTREQYDKSKEIIDIIDVLIKLRDLESLYLNDSYALVGSTNFIKVPQSIQAELIVHQKDALNNHFVPFYRDRLNSIIFRLEKQLEAI